MARCGTRLPAKMLTPTRLRAKVREAMTMTDGAGRVAAGFVLPAASPVAATSSSNASWTELPAAGSLTKRGECSFSAVTRPNTINFSILWKRSSSASRRNLWLNIHDLKAQQDSPPPAIHKPPVTWYSSVGRAGLEPATNGLTARRSLDRLQRAVDAYKRPAGRPRRSDPGMAHPFSSDLSVLAYSSLGGVLSAKTPRRRSVQPWISGFGQLTDNSTVTSR